MLAEAADREVSATELDLAEAATMLLRILPDAGATRAAIIRPIPMARDLITTGLTATTTTTIMVLETVTAGPYPSSDI